MERQTYQHQEAKHSHRQFFTYKVTGQQMSKITLQQSVHSLTVIVGFAAYMHLSAHCKLRKSTTEHHVKLSIQRLHNSLCLLLLLIKLALLLSRGILVLLVLGY